MDNWYDDYANVKALGRWLVDDQGFNAKQLQRYYEKPYNWTAEWEQMQAEREASGANPPATR